MAPPPFGEVTLGPSHPLSVSASSWVKQIITSDVHVFNVGRIVGARVPWNTAGAHGAVLKNTDV